ncbi:MAG: multiheme c-type cytochrome [Armatimonadota bacterium]|nr:multiheme c-type cytochrome [Armatimonadota bacterium]
MVDSGNLLLADRQVPVVFRILKMMNYAGVGIGRFDVHMIEKYCKAAKEDGIPILHISPEMPDGAVPYIIKHVGSIRVGIVSFGAVKLNQNDFNLRKLRYAMLRKARDESDVLILLDAADVVTDQEWLERHASRLGSPDLLIGNHKFPGFLEPKLVGKTWIMPLGAQAKYVGVVKIEAGPNKELKVNATRTFLDESIIEYPDVKKIIDEHLQSERELAKVTSAAVTKMLASPSSHGESMTSGVYYDSRTCVSCHKSQYDSWSKTKHSTALKTLVDKNRVIPACLSCHSELYRQKGTYVATDVRYNQSVECASCHINVLPHGNEGPHKDIKVKIDINNCRVCHTKEQSPDFEKKPSEYWEKAIHRS